MIFPALQSALVAVRRAFFLVNRRNSAMDPKKELDYSDSIHTRTRFIV